jgi:hypothetical protein
MESVADAGSVWAEDARPSGSCVSLEWVVLNIVSFQKFLFKKGTAYAISYYISIDG